jgi:hypothetical protein
MDNFGDGLPKGETRRPALPSVCKVVHLIVFL